MNVEEALDDFFDLEEVGDSSLELSDASLASSDDRDSDEEDWSDGEVTGGNPGADFSDEEGDDEDDDVQGRGTGMALHVDVDEDGVRIVVLLAEVEDEDKDEEVALFVEGEVGEEEEGQEEAEGREEEGVRHRDAEVTQIRYCFLSHHQHVIYAACFFPTGYSALFLLSFPALTRVVYHNALQ